MFSYSGDPEKTALDATRFLIGDTDIKDPLLQNEEIDSLLAKYNNTPLNAAIRCCETIIARLSRRPDEQVGQVKIFYSQQAAGYQSLLINLRNRLATEAAQPFAGGISNIQKQANISNQDRVTPKFTKDMMENREVSPGSDSNSFDRRDEIG